MTATSIDAPPSRDYEIWNIIGYFRIARRYIHNSEHLTCACARCTQGWPRLVSLARQFGVKLLCTCIHSYASRLCKPEAIMYRDIRCCPDRNVTRSNDQSQVRRYGSLNWIPSDGSTSVMEVYTSYFWNPSVKKEELRIFEGMHNISLLSMDLNLKFSCWIK